MKIYLEKAIFVNRAPFDKLELSFSENEIAVISAINGGGKTTILSHIADAFYEIAKSCFFTEFEGRNNKLYRISSNLYNLVLNEPSFAYLRFKLPDITVDYVDIRNICTEEQYNNYITLKDKIPFSEIKPSLENDSYVRKISSNIDKNKIQELFSNNILTYFPSYRFEAPGYLNDLYQIELDFTKKLKFSGYLKNPIEVTSGLPQLANWIMDIILDLRYSQSNEKILNDNLNRIISETLISKTHRTVRVGVGPRNFGGIRIQIVDTLTEKTIYPTIFNLSSGESSMLCIFGELLKQADTLRSNIQLAEITGIVIIDEIDKHLHIKLQKEVLPKLFNLFPNVQFIVSSHSPFLSMGLAEEAQERSKIIDPDNLGFPKDPTTNNLYTEVYDMMISENERFKEMYQSLEQKSREGTTPLIITEGKTDVKHIKKAKEKLNINDCDIELYEINEDWGESKLKLLLEQLSKVEQKRKIIGIFDRDVLKTVRDIEKDNQPFKSYSNNVYGICIPIPKGRERYTNISIEFYYSDKDLKKQKDGKCLYFNNEVVELKLQYSNKIIGHIKLDTPVQDNENTKKIFDENIGLSDWIHSKTIFAELVETDEEFIGDFDFSNFSLIFDKIRTIIDQ